MFKILLMPIGINLCISSPIISGNIYRVTLTHGLKNHYKYEIKMEKKDSLQCRVDKGRTKSQRDLTLCCT